MNNPNNQVNNPNNQVNNPNNQVNNPSKQTNSSNKHRIELYTVLIALLAGIISLIANAMGLFKETGLFKENPSKPVAILTSSPRPSTPSPFSQDGELQRGEAYFGEGKWRQGLAQAERVTQHNPSNVRAHKLAGACYLALGTGNYGEAVQSYQKACDQAPADTEARLGLATAKEANGEKADAARLYLAVRDDPGATDEQRKQAISRTNAIALPNQ